MKLSIKQGDACDKAEKPVGRISRSGALLCHQSKGKRVYREIRNV